MQPLERGYMRVWIGSLTTLLTRQALVVLFVGFPKKPSWDDDIDSAYSLSLGTIHTVKEIIFDLFLVKRDPLHSFACHVEANILFTSLPEEILDS